MRGPTRVLNCIKIGDGGLGITGLLDMEYPIHSQVHPSLMQKYGTILVSFVFNDARYLRTRCCNKII